MIVLTNIMPYTILNAPTSITNLVIGQTSVTLTMPIQIDHDVSRIEVQSVSHACQTSNVVIFNATTSLFNNGPIATGRVTNARSICKKMMVFVARGPMSIRDVYTVDYVFNTPITANSASFHGLYTLIFFSDREGRYI
jgi:hypothetical protein